jgi:uncharacterized protein (TIGR03000 family)
LKEVTHMNTRKICFVIGAPLALAALLTWSGSASAQRRGGGGSRGGDGNRSFSGSRGWDGGSRNWNGGWNGGYGNWNNGYGYRNWNDGWRGNNWGGFGWGLGLGYGLGSGFGYGRPGYWGDYGYYNSFGPGVWAHSYDYPGYYNYYGDDGYAADGTYYSPSTTYSAYPPADTGFDAGNAQAPAQEQSNNRAFVTVRVPAPDAKVWVEGQEMKDRGAIREYRTPALEEGHNYTYEVRAQWNENGKNREQTRSFHVHPGDHIMVVFGDRQNRRQDRDRAPNRSDAPNRSEKASPLTSEDR